MVKPHESRRLEAAWPNTTWPAHPGASSVAADLAALRHRMSKQSSLAVHASLDGRVFAELGGYDLPVRCQSVRKSLLSALIGIAIERGMVALDTTVGELGLDDLDALSDREKRATVRDLLMARSGIYHPAAYQQNPHPLIPPRHSHGPGDRWVYNNWDFNALGTVLERVSGMGPFHAFAEWLALPLELQDYDPDECEYAFNPVSHHPAYDFRISARDLARIGLLLLRRGRWRQTQLVPEAWIDVSTQPWSETDSGYEVFGAYGYMWWVGRPDDLGGRDFYAAIGGQGHALFVVPDHDMVLVHRNYGLLDVPKWPEVFAILRSVADLGDTIRV